MSYIVKPENTVNSSSKNKQILDLTDDTDSDIDTSDSEILTSSSSDSDNSNFYDDDSDQDYDCNRYQNQNNYKNPLNNINCNRTLKYKSNNNNKNKNKKQISAITIDLEAIRELFGSSIIKISTSQINILYKSKIESLTAQHINPRFPQQLTKQKNLMISERYAWNAGWGVDDGFREMIQNWYDGCNLVANRLKTGQNTYKSIIQPIINQKNDLSYYFFLYCNKNFEIKKVKSNTLIGAIISKQENKQTVLRLINYGIALDASKLIIGETSKTRNKNAIGKFGEGLKMGANILLHHNHGFKILTNSKNWKFSFKQSKYFRGANQRQMHVSPHQKDTKSPAQIIVTITNVERKSLDIGLDELLNTKIKEIYFCNDIDNRNYFPLYYPRTGEHIEIKSDYLGLDGNILIGDKYRNKIYSNGFYVGDSDRCYYGYNMNQNALPLNRDRCLTNRALSKLTCDIPKYWAYAIQNDKDLAKMFLILTEMGQTTHEHMEIRSITPLLNDDIATSLFKEFKRKLDEKVNPNADVDVKQNDEEIIKYFIVSNDIEKCDQDIVEKELLAKPYKINQKLYEIFCCSCKFDSIQDAVQKQLNILKNSPKSELTDIEKKFVIEFVADTKSLFPQLIDYKFYFKDTEMDIKCKIIEKSIIFKYSLLNALNIFDSNETSLFIKLVRSMKYELSAADIVSDHEFDEQYFGGYYNKIKSLKNIKIMQIELQKLRNENKMYQQLQLNGQQDQNQSQNNINDVNNDGIDENKEKEHIKLEDDNKQIDQNVNVIADDQDNDDNDDNCNMYNDDNDGVYDGDYGGYYDDDNERNDIDDDDDEDDLINQINSRKRKNMDDDVDDNDGDDEDIEMQPQSKKRRLNEHNNNQNSEQIISNLRDIIETQNYEIIHLKHQIKSFETEINVKNNMVIKISKETNELKVELDSKIDKNNQLMTIMEQQNNEIDKLKTELQILEKIKNLFPSK